MNYFLLIGVLLMSGCGSLDAVILSGADTEQAIQLLDAHGLKRCDHIEADGGFWSINGEVDSYAVLGKDTTLMECYQMFNPGVNLQRK